MIGRSLAPLESAQVDRRLPGVAPPDEERLQTQNTEKVNSMTSLPQPLRMPTNHGGLEIVGKEFLVQNIDGQLCVWPWAREGSFGPHNAAFTGNTEQTLTYLAYKMQSSYPALAALARHIYADAKSTPKRSYQTLSRLADVIDAAKQQQSGLRLTNAEQFALSNHIHGMRDNLQEAHSI